VPGPAGPTGPQGDTGPTGPIGPTSGPGGAPPFYLKRTITSAELKALFSTPIVLVPGLAGTMYYPVAAVAQYKWASPSYTGSPGLFRVGHPIASVIDLSSTLTSGASNRIAWSGTLTAGGTQTQNQYDGQPIQCSFQLANVVNGNGTVELSLWYYAVSLA
jgi:hypothetical protein